MDKTILIELLNKLDAKEWISLQKFITSPFFNESKHILSLFLYIKGCFSKGDIPHKAIAFKKVYGTKVSYQDQKIRLLMSDLLKLVETYIFHQKMKDDTTAKHLALCNYYRKIGLEKHFHRTLKKAENELEKPSYRNSTYYQSKNQLQQEYFQLSSTKQRNITLDIQQSGQYFDIAYFSARLRQACLLRTQQAFDNLPYDFEWIEKVIQHILKHHLLRFPAISLYYYAYQLYAQEDITTNFESLKEQILKFSAYFPPEEVREIYLLAINYCIRKINSGQKTYIQESLDLYKAGLQASCFIEKGILSKFTYTNIVAIGLMSKDYDWVKSFINDYKNNLKREARQSTYCLNRARLEYSSYKNYTEALNYLQKVSDKDLLNTLNAKILQLRIYYEIKAYKLLDSHLEAMTNFIRRKKVIGYHKSNFLNNIKFMQKILKLNFYDKTAYLQLMEEIKMAPILSEKEWMLVQIKDLGKTNS
jgi:hypothetical protein